MRLLDLIRQDVERNHAPANLFAVIVEKAEAAGVDLHREVEHPPFVGPWCR